MESFKVKPDSWHYKLARRYCKAWAVDFPKDFCTYWRYVMAYYPLTIVLSLFVIVTVVASVGVVGCLLHALWQNPATVGTAFGIVAVVAGIMVGLIYGIDKLLSRWDAKTPYTPKPKKAKIDGFFKTRYKAWKGQYCPMVEIDYE